MRTLLKNKPIIEAIQGMKFSILFSVIWISSVCIGQTKYEYFPRSDLEQDLDFFAEKVTSIHPKLLDSAFRKNWDKDLAAVRTSLGDSLTQNEFYLLVAPLLTSLNDAHSNFLCPMEQRKIYMTTGGLSFPFSVKLRGDSIFIAEYYGVERSLFKGGEEILKVNGINSFELVNEFRKLTGGNKASIRNKTVEMNFRSYLWMVYGFENDYSLAIKDGRSRSIDLLVKGITNEQFIMYKKQYPQGNQDLYELSTDPGRKTSVLTIRSFADLKSFCAFADSAFRVIAENKTGNLIIDIRGNPGGRSIVVDSLMNYLTGSQYAQYRKVETRISSDLIAYYKEKYPEKYEAIKDRKINEIYTVPGTLVKPHDKRSRFKGNMFLLTDNTTFSAAATFAGLIREMKAGVIIGEETGGTTVYYGDFWYHGMPNSGLQFYVSPKRFIQYGGTSPDKGVIPDFSVSNINGSIIEFTYDLIKKRIAAGDRQEI